MPTEVDERATATSSGVRMRPRAPHENADDDLGDDRGYSQSRDEAEDERDHESDDGDPKQVDE